ncbi:MAG: adenylyltransferase/cytidyltransferase family protein [Candidatus Pacebacteria bacterium]|nr:adenylyltransferase/cytidyltransferase family protein [Candidatus Paceibacterota bacterium]
MTDKRTTGLVIGKFAPLHEGHQFLLEKALSQVDYLIVLVYDVPFVTKVPVEVRMAWIKKEYPRMEVVNAGIGPRKTGHAPEINKLHIDYAQSKLPQGVKIDFVFSSENYGKFLAEALGAENVVVDKDRTKVPISAGWIREDLKKYKGYVKDFVFADLVKYEDGRI